ncbi:MAG: YHYH protein [Alphaproteobacteria bacterium]|nr:YHYH protein [Alphaproteobacteria bacterium]
MLLAPAVAAAHGLEGTHGGGASAAPPRKPLALIAPAAAAAHIRIDERGGFRFIEADGIADHPTGRFPNRGNPNRISAQRYAFRMPLRPAKAAQATPVGHQLFGVALNGVPFDAATAEYWNDDRRAGWNFEALSGAVDLGLDASNAHVQPNGAYHYHGVPIGLMERMPQRAAQPVLLGYAADGFPIYGPLGWRDPRDARSGLVELRPSWRLKAGTRPSGPGIGPGGRHDGTYVQDYEHVPGSGDLDACNGRDSVTPEHPQGTYHYVATAAFPFLPRCWTGTPDSSFFLKGPGGHRGPGGPGGRPPPPGGRGGPPPFGPPPRQ